MIIFDIFLPVKYNIYHNRERRENDGRFYPPQPFCRPRRGGCAELLRLLPLLSNEQLRGLIQAAEQLLEPKWA